MDQKSLERYIDRVIKLQEERSQRLSADELESIAIDLGLSPDELRREVDAHVQRGRGYLDQSLLDDAIKELREAEALAPGEVEVLILLARAHTLRWESTSFPDDREVARKMARAALDIEPGHTPAFEILGRLEHGAEGPQRRGAGSDTARAAGMSGLVLALGLGVLALFAAGGVVGSLVLDTRSDDVVIKEVVRASELDVPMNDESTSEPDPEPDQKVSTGGEPGSTDLELELTGDAAGDVEFDIRRSRLDVYSESSFYGLKAIMKNVSDRELTRVDTVIELMDAEGQVLHRDDPSLLWNHQPVLRPGDISPVNVTQRASPDVRRVRLTIKRTEGTPASSNYPPSKPITVKMGAVFPEHLKLDVRERLIKHNPRDNGEGYFNATFEIENVGDSAIKELKVQLDLFAGDGELLETKTGIVTYSMTPAIYPGETWLESFIAKVENDYERYELTVTELE